MNREFISRLERTRDSNTLTDFQKEQLDECLMMRDDFENSDGVETELESPSSFVKQSMKNCTAKSMRGKRNVATGKAEAEVDSDFKQVLGYDWDFCSGLE